MALHSGYPMINKNQLVPIHKWISKWRALAAVSNSEMSSFSQGQGNQGIARRRTSVRRTSDPTDWHRDCEKGPFLDGNQLRNPKPYPTISSLTALSLDYTTSHIAQPVILLSPHNQLCIPRVNFYEHKRVSFGERWRLGCFERHGPNSYEGERFTTGWRL